MQVGIDYELTPWVAVGLRGGNARFVQEQQVSHSEQVAGYPHLNRTVNEIVLLDPFAIWAGPAVTYLVNPGNRFNIAVTGAAGEAFVSGTNGLNGILRGEVAANYKLSEAIDFRAAASLEGDWINGASAIDSSSATRNTGSSQLNGVSIGSVAASRHPSQAYGISFGISIRP